MRQTNDCTQLRQALAVLLPAQTGSTLEATARLLGVGRSSVPRLQANFRQRCLGQLDVRPQWGGRRKALMSPAQEREFLAPWAEQAQSGGLLGLSPIRAALAQHLGRRVAPSVVYRFLARHGWRKVAPDTRHPQSDPQVQEDWKKNSRKCWQPC